MTRQSIIQRTLLLLLLPGISGLYAQEDKTSAQPEAVIQPETRNPTAESAIIGFEDKDNDGINDKFCDANGDGKNDLSDKPYPHKFAFVDKNKDGINDTWQDVDGDGVNDNFHKMSKSDKKKKDNVVLDYDNDGKNDVTGETIDSNNLQKQNTGFWDETTGKINGPFIDEDGNGMDDRIERTQQRRHMRNRDFFVDEDGDGICDGRSESLKRGRHQRGRGGR